MALARALAPKPEVILLDEPFSNLDASLRDRVRRELRTILTEARTTAVFVTHDQEEALATSDIVAVMREGRVLQADTPGHLYSNLADRWVAEFLGDADILESVARDGRSTPRSERSRPISTAACRWSSARRTCRSRSVRPPTPWWPGRSSSAMTNW